MLQIRLMVDQQSKGNIEDIMIAHLSIRLLKNRAFYIQIKNLITISNFDIFTILETWLNVTAFMTVR